MAYRNTLSKAICGIKYQIDKETKTGILIKEGQKGIKWFKHQYIQI